MKHLPLFVLVAVFSGCSTVITKEFPFQPYDNNHVTRIEDGMWGYPYSGTRFNFMWWDCWGNFFTTDNVTNENPWVVYIFVGVFTTPLLVSDTIMSVSMDTLLLPIDYFYTPTKEHYQTTYCLGLGDTWGKDEDS